ncbi:MAG: DUF4350 domain-containing protein [Acidobacteria bacterium]|nr:DUF4350 domain-containing protein [Acidobacteriota bacterium]MCA1642447.1 DUF4350 domain-containing protein [Acidobacteriota bacterium]
MRGRFSILIFVVLVGLLLVALNAASYVRVEREPELETNPDRSTSNAGATGTRAVYEYFEASGHKVMRWREPVESLLKDGKASPATFVVVGAVRRRFTDEERKNLSRWVARGGRLVVIDRIPEQTLAEDERWGVSSVPVGIAGFNARADDVEGLLAGTQPFTPTQPTLITNGVERVAPSRLATRLRAVGKGETNDTNTDDDAADSGDATDATPTPSQSPPPAAGRGEGDGADGEETESEAEEGEPPPPTPTPRPGASPRPSAPPVVISPQRGGIGMGRAEDYAEPDAPVLNFTDERGALVAEFTRGRGRVVVLSDPFIVANNGISRADNLQLATNLIASGGGLIAFDEYHQGRGAAHNQLLSYFAGTPVVAMFAQGFLIAAVVVWSRGRRFARPLPAPRPDRRSKLEFVASMAELQQRARAFDLAIENIYSRTRRALARYGGTDPAAAPEEIASAVAARSGTDRARLEQLLRECEDAAKGAPVGARRALELAASLRELESSLGIRMREREIKQAARR